MSGPLPDPAHRRRNKPTIPTTTLPANGFAGPYPRPPKWVELGSAGAAWWKWAWRTPQAAAWSAGDVPAVCRRAGLEDDLAAVSEFQSVDFAELLGIEGSEALKQLEFIVRRLHSLAGGKLAISREARELDDRLGLTPKGRLSLRMTITEHDEAQPAKTGPTRTSRRLRAVDAATG